MMLLYTITLVSPNGGTVVFDHGGLKVVAIDMLFQIISKRYEQAQ